MTTSSGEFYGLAVFPDIVGFSVQDCAVPAFEEPAFIEQLSGLKYQDVTTWDSVGHMSLIAALEDAFDIMMDTDDIIDLSSYEKGKEILSKEEYGVEF